MSNDPAMLREALGEFAKLVAPLVAVTKVKANAPDAIEQLDATLKRLPSCETFGQTMEEIRSTLQRLVEDALSERANVFKRIEAEFVRQAKDEQKPCRELSDGWRIGMFEFQFKREQGRARACYNHEVVVDWIPISSREDLKKLELEAENRLKGAELPDDLLIKVFWEAYEHERQRRLVDGRPQPYRVPILDFYREVRVRLVRHELEGQKPDKRLKNVEMPRWNFLYNLDRYRSLGQSVPDNRRLALETGSQREVTKGLGLSVNGLDATQEYKTVCYIIAVSNRP